jgi:hypothetical protein
VRYRLQDAADLAWRPVDAVLGSRLLSNLFVWGPIIVMLVAIMRHDGRFGPVADVQDPVALGIFLFAVIRVGRWWRQIKPPEPKPRRVKEREEEEEAGAVHLGEAFVRDLPVARANVSPQARREPEAVDARRGRQ